MALHSATMCSDEDCNTLIGKLVNRSTCAGFINLKPSGPIGVFDARDMRLVASDLAAKNYA